MQMLQKLIRFARKSRREQFQTARATILGHLAKRGWVVPHLGNDRTAYVIGVFGSGRWYVNDIILKNIGERAKYFRDEMVFPPGPTSMIYSGHSTLRHVCRAALLPEDTLLVLKAVRSGFADMIFVYRHPLDSLLSNWIYWRNYLQHRKISGISQIYNNANDLCADLEQNFLEFKTFADGDPVFFSSSPGLPFLSFPQFVEETELHLQVATLALRLENFVIDPFKEFCKIVEVMTVDLDLSNLRVAPPRTTAYGYLAVKERVSRFRNFIDEMDAETKSRIKNIGYSL
jgi:hypothetical protein